MVNVIIGEDTEKHTLRILENGDILGEMSILDNFPRSASAEAMTETQAIVMNREQFEDLIQKYPVLAMKFIEMMGRRMRKMDTQYKSAIRYRGAKKK